LSRDLVDSTAQDPEALNPYQFVYNNPYIYSDPSGMITMADLATSQNIEKILQGLQNQLSQQVRQYAIDKAKGVAGDVVTSVFKALMPTSLYSAVEGFETAKRFFKAGQELEDIMTNTVCDVLGGTQYADYLWIQPRVAKDGNPVSDGYSCGDDIPNNWWFFTKKLFQPRPDFIIKEGGPATTDKKPRAYLIGDVKLSGNAIVSKIGSGQWEAIMNYAKKENRHQYAPIALYMTFWGLTDRESKKLEESAIAKGVIARAVSVLDKARGV
jgi:hypothetical protein